jgi:methylthioribose-1-phosphate isomerase
LSFSAYLSNALRTVPEADFLASSDALKAHIIPKLDFLFTARPTAVNLGATTRRLAQTLQVSIASGMDVRSTVQRLILEGRSIADEDVGRNKEMAKRGGEWLADHVKEQGSTGDGLNVLTVCNTGSLATSVSTDFLTKSSADFSRIPPRDTEPL